ncbi:MAG TPA: hypothetical protein VFQ79_13785, partial [Bryobacteraceae bacterium]|nr:hypothetical protein [Bryobacteraceae bacterium]
SRPSMLLNWIPLAGGSTRHRKDPASGEVPARQIFEQLDRMLQSRSFCNSRDLTRFLRWVVERKLAGETDRLKEQVIGVEVFGRPTDFNPATDTIVRTQASNLRKKLATYYQTDGLLDEVLILLPPRGYVPRIEHRASVQEAHPAFWRRRLWPLVFGVFAIIVLAMSAVAFWRYPKPHWTVQRLTFDNQSTWPAISRDGRFVVYSSPRADRANSDIWWHPLDGSGPRQLTSYPAIDTTPDISPDGSMVAFRSWRDGGGIYVVPRSGGAERLLVPRGFSPRFSPDGRWIAYAASTGKGGSSIFLIRPSGGQPHNILADVEGALYPLWTRDGKRIIYIGLLHDGASEKEEYDWFITDVDTGSPAPGRSVAMGVSEMLRKQGFPDVSSSTIPMDWNGAAILFNFKNQRISELWQLPISPETWKPTGPASRLLLGPELQYARSASVGGARILAAATDRQTNDLWSVPLSSGVPRQVTRDESLRQGMAGTIPRVTADGNKLIFPSERSGHLDLWLKDLPTGNATRLTSRPGTKNRPAITPDGTTVAWNQGESGSRSLHVMDIRTGTPRWVCSDCGDLVDIASDARSALTISRGRLSRIGLANGQSSEILNNPAITPVHASFSPDIKWVAFAAFRSGEDPVKGFIAPLADPLPGEDSWIRLTEAPHHLSFAWSPDGNSVYYFSMQDGFRCLWSQTLNPSTKRPVNSPRAVCHFHKDSPYPWFGSWIAAAHDKIILNLSTTSSDVFIAKRPF